MNTYRILFKVRPGKGHPKFFDIQFGMLCLFLLDETAETAAERALTIVEQLPYEVVSVEAARFIGGVSQIPETNRCIEEARLTGFSYMLLVSETGADEESFFKEK